MSSPSQYFNIVMRSGSSSNGTKPNEGPAPDLIPFKAGIVQTTRTEGDMPAHLDILNHHAWTNSPPASRVDVPRLILDEQRIAINPTINQIAYNVIGAGEKLGAAKDKVQEAATSLKNAKDSKASPIETANKVLGTKRSYKTLTASSVDPQKPYDFLYTTTATGFKYTLPYFSNTWRSGNLGFGQGGGEAPAGIISSLGVDALGQGIGDVVKSLNLTAPGVYIEQPKFYNFTGRESSYTVQFPLLNTGTYEDVLRNWQFLFLLTYQNMPNRISRDQIEPPVIYTARIPGMWFSRYASITNLTVEFQGARRMMSLDVPVLQEILGAEGESTATSTSKSFETIVPDAYNVSITVTELFGETKNMAYEILSNKFKITVNQGGVDNENPNAGPFQQPLGPDEQ